MKNLYLSILALCVSGFLNAQPINCAGGRYYDQLFSTVDVTSDITYGQNMNISSQMQSLEMDIYRPQGDVETNRPVIILAHGGSFVAGNKNSPDIVALCNSFARMGYVAVSIEYRLQSYINIFLAPPQDRDSLYLNIVYDAVCDMKAAMRYLRKTVALDGNPYGINPNIVIVGGVSAGSFMGIHVAYLDQLAELPPEIVTDSDPVEGDSGNPGYSSNPQAVINLCGAIGDTIWMNSGDEPIVSVHSMDDGTVPYGSAMVTPYPNFEVIEVDGSSSIHARALNIGLNTSFLSFSSGGHCGFLASDYDTTVAFVKSFLHEQFCIQSVSNEVQPGEIFFSAYPNPASDGFLIDIPGNEMLVTAKLYNLVGQVCWSGVIPHGQNLYYVPVEALDAGMYILHIESNGKQASKKIMKR